MIRSVTSPGHGGVAPEVIAVDTVPVIIASL